jgi:signal transduction histidine kinase
VRVQISGTGRTAEIVVADNGKGIRADVLPHIFERFRQGDGTTARPHGGLGMGLAIVRHTVELHGGTVQADSAGEGKGARFLVTLPLTESRRRVDPAQLRPPQSAHPKNCPEEEVPH